MMDQDKRKAYEEKLDSFITTGRMKWSRTLNHLFSAGSAFIVEAFTPVGRSCCLPSKRDQNQMILDIGSRPDKL